MKILALIVGWLLSLVLVSYVTANALYTNQLAAFGVKLDEFQAGFALNHMEKYREIENELSNGNYKEAQEKAKLSKDLELSLLAGILRDHPSSSISKLISDRDAKLTDQLKSYKSPFEVPWSKQKWDN